MRMTETPSASWGKEDHEFWLMYMLPLTSAVQKYLTGGRYLKC